jgi:acyl-CoA reductase-like NAD-dependent aldehyde dehydrogenase
MSSTPDSSTADLSIYDPFIGGEQVPPSSGERFPSVDPTSGQPWALIGSAAESDVDRAVRNAAETFRGNAWRNMSQTRRGRLLMRLADLIAENAERIAAIETRDNGKLYRELLAQLHLVPEWLYYYGGLADKIEGKTIPLDRTSILNYTRREPLGVVGVITPWNSPVFITMLATAPALAAGNTVVVKPSEVTSASMVEVARLAVEAGFPPGALNVVTGLGPVGKALVEHPGVAMVALTGGTATGRAVAVAAAQRLARATLELGGKSANIVFEDANLEAAESGVLAGIFAAAGQTCVAGSRLLVHQSIHDELVGRVVERARAIRVGDPMREDTQMGPIATESHLERVEGFVTEAVSAGAEALAGGKRARVPERPDGFFFEPTILAGARPDSRVAQEEIFGPVLAVFPFASDEEAFALANDTEFGLAAGVWTQNVSRAHRAARTLEAGTVWVNMYRSMAPQSPFGGYKGSGLGRQNGIEAIDEYLQTKSVWLELSDEVQDPFILRV